MAQKKPKMTVAQFMKELAKHKGEFFVDPTGRIVTHGVDAEGCIVHCPITRVCLAMTGRQFHFWQDWKAWQIIGLPKAIAREVSGASTITPKDFRATPTINGYRTQMLKVLGLKEVS